MVGNDVENENLKTFEKMLEASALICVREACRHVTTLKPLALRAATALLRHTDVIAADNGIFFSFYNIHNCLLFIFTKYKI